MTLQTLISCKIHFSKSIYPWRYACNRARVSFPETLQNQILVVFLSCHQAKHWGFHFLFESRFYPIYRNFETDPPVFSAFSSFLHPRNDPPNDPPPYGWCLLGSLFLRSLCNFAILRGKKKVEKKQGRFCKISINLKKV